MTMLIVKVPNARTSTEWNNFKDDEVNIDTRIETKPIFYTRKKNTKDGDCIQGNGYGERFIKESQKGYKDFTIFSIFV